VWDAVEVVRIVEVVGSAETLADVEVERDVEVDAAELAAPCVPPPQLPMKSAVPTTPSAAARREAGRDIVTSC
jgi:hypothetical protein